MRSVLMTPTWVCVAGCVLGACAGPDRATLDGPPEVETRASFRDDVSPMIELGARNSIPMTLNGVRVDRIMFDTGVTGLAVEPRVARRLDLPRIGTATAISPGGTREIPRCWLERVEVGPLLIEGTDCVEVRTGFTGALGFSGINGLVGATILDHAVVEMRLGEGTLTLRDPRTYTLPDGAEWVGLVDGVRGYAVEGAFDGGHGVLLIDSGAELSVQMGGDAVERFGLDEGRQGRRGRIATMGGSHSTLRTRLAWIEVGGHRVEGVEADLVTDPSHAIAEGVAGLVGRDFLERFVLVLDAGGGRAALIPLDD